MILNDDCLVLVNRKGNRNPGSVFLVYELDANHSDICHIGLNAA